MMIHDITVAPVDTPRPDGHAKFGTLTQHDFDILKRMGTGNNAVPGNIFTVAIKPRKSGSHHLSINNALKPS